MVLYKYSLLLLLLLLLLLHVLFMNIQTTATTADEESGFPFLRKPSLYTRLWELGCNMISVLCSSNHDQISSVNHWAETNGTFFIFQLFAGFKSHVKSQRLGSNFLNPPKSSKTGWLIVEDWERSGLGQHHLGLLWIHQTQTQVLQNFDVQYIFGTNTWHGAWCLKFCPQV